MIGWKDEKRDEIQMYVQPINELTQQIEPSLACYELLLYWHCRFCCQEKFQLPAQVSAEQRGRRRWEKRQERSIVERQPACLWLFFKEAFLVD